MDASIFILPLGGVRTNQGLLMLIFSPNRTFNGMNDLTILPGTGNGNAINWFYETSKSTMKSVTSRICVYGG